MTPDTTATTSPRSSTTPAFPSPDALAERVRRLLDAERPRYRRLWAYYRNPMRVCRADLASSSDAAAVGNRPYRQAQEWGLPARITGCHAGAEPLAAGVEAAGVSRKEVVIENDIGWRIDTNVDYLFGKPLVVASAAPDPARRQQIGELLRLILAANGGILFLQQLALLGGVYGFVDVLVKLDLRAATTAASTSATDPTVCGTQDLGQPPYRDGGSAIDRQANPDPTPDGAGPSAGRGPGRGNAGAGSALPAAEAATGFDEGTGPSTDTGASHPSPAAPSIGCPTAALARLARLVRLEVVEPARSLPFVSPDDYRVVLAYAQCFDVPRQGAGETGHADDGVTTATPSWLDRLLRRGHRRHLPPRLAAARRATLAADDENHARVIEVITPHAWTRYVDGALAARGANSLGQLPLVHIQNTAVPFEYAGASDVEPLVPLQDELNTRLSDRAHRITMQSFKMYLGKGIADFIDLPVAPGRMWATDNLDAEVVSFGGDAAAPSEDAHVAELREALDKASGVTPIAAGAIKGRIGRITSAAALRVTMQALLAKTEKKRTTYGAGVARMCELALAWLDRAGLFPTTPDERRVELSWPSPLPANDLEKLQEAEAKARLGVPREILLRELGY